MRPTRGLFGDAAELPDAADGAGAPPMIFALRGYAARSVTSKPALRQGDVDGLRHPDAFPSQTSSESKRTDGRVRA
jgi:hypothetical protein